MNGRLASLVVLLACLCPVSSLRAQSQRGTQVLLPTGGDHGILWQRLRNFAERGDWDTVLEGLSRYVDLIQNPEVNTVVSSGRFAVGVRRLYSQLVRRLPDAQRRSYRERLDSVVEPLWEDARESLPAGEVRRLRRRLVRDYPETSLQRALLREEIDATFERGDWERARVACERLLGLLAEAGGPEESGIAAQKGRLVDRARARLILAQIFAAWGDRDRLQAQIASLETLRSSPLFDELEETFHAEVARTMEAAPLVLESYLVRRKAIPSSSLRPQIIPVSGPPGDAAPPFQLGRTQWQRPLPQSLIRPMVDELSRDSEVGDVPLPYHADASGDLVVFQHSDRVVAFDAPRSVVTWSAQLEPDSLALSGIRLPLIGPRACYVVSGQAVRALDRESGKPRWMTSFEYEREGKRLVVRSSLDAADGPAGGDGGATPPEVVQEGPDADAGDASDPQRAAEPSGDDRTEDALCLLSPPSFTQDGLAVALTVRVNDESLIFLAALDPDGRERWSTFLGSVGSVNFLGLGSVNSIPLAHGNSVYLLTNQGLLASVDTEDGAIEWVHEYPTLDSRAQIEAIRTSNRWQTNPIARVGRSLLIAPADSSQLLAIDEGTGAEIWRHRRERNSTLVGVTDEACIIAGRSASAIAHSGPRRGTVLWTFPPEASDFVPLGRPALTASGLLLPGRHNLVVLSPRDGRVLSRTAWDFGGGGNLLAAGQLLAVCTPESLQIYGDRQAEEEHLDRVNGVTPRALLARAKYHLRHYEIDRGLAELDRWVDSAPPPPSPNSELDSLHLDLAELTHRLSRSPAGAPYATRLLRARFLLERTPERKVKAAIELAKKLEKDDRPAEALKVYHSALLHDRSETEIVPDEFRAETIARVGGVLPIDGDAYIRDRIRELRRRTDDPYREFAELEAQAGEALKDAHKKSTTLAYEQVIHLFPYTRAAAQAYLELSLSYRDRLSYVQAIEALKGYLRDYEDDPHADSGEIIRANLVLINLLSHVGERVEAKERSLRAIERYGDRVATGVQGMTRGETVREYLEPRLVDSVNLNLPEKEKKGLGAPLRMGWRSPADLQAINRRFLEPEGPWPAEIEDCFLTQSTDVVECRDATNGLSRWRLSLTQHIPGFIGDSADYFTRLPRSGSKALRGRFEGGRLILYDQSNLFAVDAVKGSVRWHKPFGEEEERTASGIPPRLRERLRRVLIGSSGIYAVSSEKKLYHFNLQGETLWEKELPYTPTALRSPTLAHNKLFVHSSQPPGMRVHDALTGELLRPLGNQSVFLDPIELPDGRLLLPYANRIELLDLATERVDWHFEPPGARGTIETLDYFEDHPDECVVVYNRLNNLPSLVGVSLRNGRELWRYEKEFGARLARFSVFREGSRLYVIYGDHSWYLVALELRRQAAVDKPLIAPVWPGSQKLGTFYSGASARRLYVGSNVILFHDPNNSISAYDKAQGTPRPAVADAINKFLTEKGGFASALVGDKIVILTDSGDCAFEPAPNGPAEGATSLVDMDLVRAWLSEPSNADRLVALAQAYFRRGRLQAAIDLLDRSLISEEALAGQSQKNQLRIRYMLDGLKQEFMERQFKLANEAPAVHTRRLRTSPNIDGELNDWWDVGSRIRLETPQHIGMVPGPDSLKHWEGEEDLSAILYTGWDDEYFYFALDVTDDVLYPYDRDAEGWKGDCLIIGLDPTGNMGYRQSGNDQLMTLALTLPKRRNEDKNADDDEDGQPGEDEEDEEDEAGKPDGRFAVKRKPDNTGAIYEVGLPWESFRDETTMNRPPHRGYSFGLSLLLTDDDTGQGASKTLSINPCQLLPDSQKSSLVWRFIIPNFFPRVTLE